MKNNNKTKKAFTLMEIVVIMFILSVGVVAVLSLVRRSSEFESVKANLLKASLLSQEGIDIMRNIRNTNIINGDSYDNWNGISSPAMGSVSYYKVDYLSPKAISIPRNMDSAVLQEEDGMFAHLDYGTDSIFKRMIIVSPLSDYSTEVSSQVNWSERGQVYDFTLVTILYDLSN